MTTKIQNTAKKLTVAVAVIAICVSTTYGQGNSGGNSQGLWSAKGKDTVVTNRHVKMLQDARIKGLLKIGPNSLTLGSFVDAPGEPDIITSTNGVVNFGGDPTFSDIKIGIGLDPGGAPPQTPDYTLQLKGDGTNTNGSILSVGSALGIGAKLKGDNLGGGPRPRFIWYAKKAAIRAGEAPDGFVNDANIGDFSVAFGERTRASGPHSFAVGGNVEATDSGAMILGIGFDDANPIINTIINSLMVGFNSDRSTLFVGPSPGPGVNTTGNVGIGDISGMGVVGLPTNKLEINADMADESGLTFTRLTEISPFAASNATSTVLSVDDLGRVILVEDQIGGVGVDNDWTVGLTTTVLTNATHNVGIGTTDPQKVLHILTRHATGAESHQGIRLEDRFTDLINPNQSSVTTWDIEPIALEKKLFIGTPDNRIMTFTEEGRIGIGTESPGARLHIGGIGSGDGIKLGNNFRLRDFSGNFGSNTMELLFERTTGNSQLVLFGNTDSRMDLIVADGKVGIGITSPQNPLHLHRTVATEIFAYFTNSHTGAGPNLGFKIGIGDRGEAEFRQHHTEGGFTFSTLDNPQSNNLTPRMTITDNGNVGIGVTAPIFSLEIRGKTSNLLRLLNKASGQNNDRIEIGVLNNLVTFKTNGAITAPDILFTGGNVIISERLFINRTSGGLLNCRLNVGGLLCSFGVPRISDQSLKKNVTTLTNSLEKVKQLRGVNFEWDLDTLPEPLHMAGTQIGFVAQEVDKVLPEVVLHSDSGVQSVDYGRIIPVLVEAIKELHQIVANLQPDTHSSINARLDALEDCINNLPPGLCGGKFKMSNNNSPTNYEYGNGGSQNIGINSQVRIMPDNSLNTNNTALYQNHPNPFRHETKFSYSIARPGNVELLIHTYTGQHVQTLLNKDQDSGSYSIDWDTTNIPPGLYFYTLKVDGMQWVKKAMRVK